MFKLDFNPQSFRKYLSNTSWLLAERVFNSVIILLVGVYIARYLGPSRFGLLNYAKSFVVLFCMFANLGFENIIVRDLVNEPGKRELIIGTGWRLRLLGALLALSLAGIAVQFTSNDTFTNLLIFIIAGGFFFQSFDVIDYYFRSIVQAKYIVYARFFQVIITSLLKVVFIIIKAPLVWFAVAILLESVLHDCALVAIYTKKAGALRAWRFDYPIAKKLLKSSYPLIFAGIATAIYFQIDQVMIKEMLGNAAVGYYVAAVRLHEAWYFLPIIISSSVFPAIISAKKNNENIYNNRIQRLYNLSVIISLSVAIIVTIFGKHIIRLLYGMEFMNAVPVLQIYAWTGIFTFLGITSEKWLMAENLTKIYFYRSLAGVICNIILNWILILRLGIKGAAFATLLTQFFVFYLFDLFNKKTFINFKMKSKALLLYVWIK